MESFFNEVVVEQVPFGPARFSSEGTVWLSSVMARVSTADSTLMVGQGLSRMAIAAAAT